MEPQPPKPRGRARGRAIPRDRSRSPTRPGDDTPKLKPENVATPEPNPPMPERPRSAFTQVKKFEGNKKGVKGSPIQLQANYFQLGSVPQFNIFQSCVQFEPDEERSIVRKALLASQKAHLNTGYLFDGTILFASTKLQSNPLVLNAKRHDGTEVKITIRFVKQLQSGDFQYTQVFNFIVRKVMAMLDLKLVGKNFYDPAAKVDLLQHNLQLWPGYIASVRQYENQLMMTASISTKVIRTQSAHQVISELFRSAPGADFRQRVTDIVLGSVVVTTYNNLTYRVDDIEYNVTPNDEFPTKDGGKITFIDYYKHKYGITIKDPHQPMLVSKSKARDMRAGASQMIFLVPELCRMTGLTDDMRSNFQLMKAIADHTRSSPSQRINKLLAFANRLLEKRTVVEELEKWNMKIAPNLVKFQGRVLPREVIVQGKTGNLKYDSGSQVDWTNNLKSNEALVPGELKTWVAIIPRNLKNEAEDFLKELMMTGSAMKMQISNPFVEVIENDSQGVYVNSIDSILSRQVPDIIVCFVSNNRGDRYSAIKKRCCVERNVISQIVTGRCLSSRSRRSIATKVILQMNCKIGGAPWTTSNPPACQDLMVVGFDTSKDSINKGVAFGAIVASMNDAFSQYFSQVFECNKGEDLSRGICNSILNALHKFKAQKNGRLPSRIIFYRDGVDEFSDNSCMQEVEKLQDMLRCVYKGPDFKLAYILVSRRCNARLFMAGGNPPAGTIVDDCITLPHKYDFFLVSQSVRQGSVNPTSYQVLFDSTGFSACQMQRFTYKMTHLYFNWSGTVKVPAPAQYARKLSVLVSQSLHKTPNIALSDSLFYL